MAPGVGRRPLPARDTHSCRDVLARAVSVTDLDHGDGLKMSQLLWFSTTFCDIELSSLDLRRFHQMAALTAGVAKAFIWQTSH